MAKNLGYGSLLLQIDPDDPIVLQVRYADLGGRPLKTYRLIERMDLGGRSFPGEVQLRHFSEGFLTTIHYEYWLPERPPPPSLFVPDTLGGKFIQRLKEYVAEAGLGDRIEAELNEADEQFQEFLDRLSQMKGGEEAVRGVDSEGDAPREP
jgi:hypothetical protein